MSLLDTQEPNYGFQNPIRVVNCEDDGSWHWMYVETHKIKKMRHCSSRVTKYLQTSSNIQSGQNVGLMRFNHLWRWIGAGWNNVEIWVYKQVCVSKPTSEAKDNLFCSPPEIPRNRPGIPITVSAHFANPN